MQSNVRALRRIVFWSRWHMKKKDECKLDAKEEYYDEHDSEEESEEDRDFYVECLIVECIACVMWDENWFKIKMNGLILDCMWIDFVGSLLKLFDFLTLLCSLDIKCNFHTMDKDNQRLGVQ